MKGEWTTVLEAEHRVFIREHEDALLRLVEIEQQIREKITECEIMCTEESILYDPVPVERITRYKDRGLVIVEIDGNPCIARKRFHYEMRPDDANSVAMGDYLFSKFPMLASIRVISTKFTEVDGE